MISSKLDLIVSDLPERTVQMTSGCAYGEENALTEIGDGTEVTLVNGKYAEKAIVRFRSGGECFFGSFELGAPLARRLRLSGDKRCKLVYDEKSQSLRIGPSPVSAASASIGSDAKLGAGRLSIGYALLSRLGLPDDGRNHILTIRHGGQSRRLAVRSPANLFEGGLNLHPDAARALKLRTGAAYKLSYDQRAKELVVKPAGGASAGGGPGNGEASRPSDASRSGGANRSGGTNRSSGAARSDGQNRSAGAPGSRQPASSPRRAPGAAGKHAGPQRPPARAGTRKEATTAAPRTGARPSPGASKPDRLKSLSRPAPVFHAAHKGGAKRSAPDTAAVLPKPYMPKGRA
ncbi:hypothetical protein [Cohnella sp. GbtcB17]|uniref:hypothetical protein n=1 Tax=Cohnella sp. GbtcB17 TaxID=2824762 RepID=UPI001C3114A5|nr:hypothetical protein [Cohnella sp. GbtcB17]